MQPYPKNITEDTESNTKALGQIARLRDEDIRDRNNFPQIFGLGRKVGKIPTSSADVAETDRLGDFNFDASFLYMFVTGAVWRRIALATW